ncbi:MAG TPA: bifunctional phosphopantothenoylcysteine decarboxylase/phosphopantothenate--cysteine ligase CoaBC, partial [Candidatus Avipropionibacterium avicola]|nr:bifunctional phosphopantothenoylcysteine decarboxylase/phosphopantothenate--cysteine ligase CoaBC [Candidatus Avipropionibacterium avicola]
MSRVVVGVSGGIAAYKACEVVRRLSEAGHDVTVVPTNHALEFVGATTWSALSGRPVHTGVFSDTHLVNHVRIGQQADLVVVVPATADLMARAATGRADDLLTNVLLTTTAPVLMCPAMHTEMWQHPATTANVATLRSRGTVVLDPAAGRLTGADSGPGRLPEPAEIVATALSLLVDPALAASAAQRDLTGLRVAVSAGGTREALDPVRFLGNASSGRMGVALARAAALRGARVDLVAAHLEVEPPSNTTVTAVSSTADLDEAMRSLSTTCDVLVMAVAAADFTPGAAATGKIKKSGDSGLTLQLEQTTDVLAGLSRQRARAGQTIVGFAAETPQDDDLLDLARA